MALVARWHGPARRATLRFACVLAAEWVLPFPLDRLPWLGDRVDTATSHFWDAVVPAFARYVLRLPDAVRDVTNGTGDNLFEWARMALWIATAAAAALFWAVAERKPSIARDAKLAEWLHVALRYKLAAIMLVYGLAKVFNTQFPMPKPTGLLIPYGEASPQGLLWRFMGASTAYTFFGGTLECLGAVLLFARRTATLGALLLITVLSNVVMLNLCYDVAVKLYSSMYLGIAVYLAAPDLGRIAKVLVFHEPVAGRTFAPHFRGPAMLWTGYVLKAAIVAVLVLRQARIAYFAWSSTHGDVLAPLIAGAYQVESLRIGEDDVPSTGERVAVQRGFFALRHPDGTRTGFAFDMDLGTHKLIGENGNVLRYRGDGHPGLALEGTIDGVTYAMTLRRLPLTLLERPFEWVMEKPFYR